MSAKNEGLVLEKLKKGQINLKNEFDHFLKLGFENKEFYSIIDDLERKGFVKDHGNNDISLTESGKVYCSNF